MKKFAFAALAAISLPSVAHSAPILWTLQDVTFDDGGIANGSFVYDADTGSVSQFSISVSGGTTADLTAFTYDNTNSFYFLGSSDRFSFLADSRLRYLGLIFASTLTDSGGTIGILSGPPSSYECDNCGTARLVASGSITTDPSAVPEPASWAMLIGGFGVAGAAMRRRKVAVSFA